MCVAGDFLFLKRLLGDRYPKSFPTPPSHGFGGGAQLGARSCANVASLCRKCEPRGAAPAAEGCTG